MRPVGPRCLASLLLMATGAMAARAQVSGSGGSGSEALSSRVELTYSHYRVDSAGQVSRWMQYVILWRGQSGWRQAQWNPASGRDATQMYKDARLAALAANRSFFGGSSGANAYWGEIDDKNHRLYVVGHDYAIPGRDSALVVLIDRIDNIGGPPVVIGAAVVDGRLPPDVDGKTWTSGDTTLSVRSARTPVEAFMGVLKQDPLIAAFLSNTP